MVGGSVRATNSIKVLLSYSTPFPFTSFLLYFFPTLEVLPPTLLLSYSTLFPYPTSLPPYHLPPHPLPLLLLIFLLAVTALIGLVNIFGVQSSAIRKGLVVYSGIEAFLLVCGYADRLRARPASCFGVSLGAHGEFECGLSFCMWCDCVGTGMSRWLVLIFPFEFEPNGKALYGT